MLLTIDSLKSKVQSEISNTSDSALCSKNYSETLYNKLCIKPPYLDTGSLNADIAKEVIGDHNAPLNVSFYHGQVMDFVLYTIPIRGDLDIFLSLINYKNWHEKVSVEQAMFYYKEFSERTIDGNDEVIESISANLKSTVDSINIRLNEFKIRADEMNEELRRYIDQIIEKQKRARIVRSDSKNKLNPFV